MCIFWQIYIGVREGRLWEIVVCLSDPKLWLWSPSIFTTNFGTVHQLRMFYTIFKMLGEKSKRSYFMTTEKGNEIQTSVCVNKILLDHGYAYSADHETKCKTLYKDTDCILTMLAWLPLVPCISNKHDVFLPKEIRLWYLPVCLYMDYLELKAIENLW